MKTISIQAKLIESLNSSHRLLTSPQLAAGSRPAPSWLPAPPLRRQVDATKTWNAKPTRRSSSLWIPLKDESLLEKIFYSGLVLAAAVGIAYGFSCLIDMVGNWAGVHASIGRMLQ